MALLNRRNLLYSLACATGWPAVALAAPEKASEAESTGIVALQTPATPAPNPTPVEVPLPAERVLGIGGLFFRAKDPKALAAWYRANLGISPAPASKDDKPWHTEAGTTAFTPFSPKSKYLGEPTQMWMVNFRVRDLEKMAAQLRAGGATVDVDPEHYPYGRFAKTHDPEGNPIELWEPVA